MNCALACGREQAAGRRLKVHLLILFKESDKNEIKGVVGRMRGKMMLYCSVLVYAVLRLELFIAVCFDEEWRNIWLKGMGKEKCKQNNVKKNRRQNLSLMALSMLMGACVSGVFKQSGGDGWNALILCIIGASFLMATVTDYFTCNVYRFVWWIVWMAGLILMFCNIFLESGDVGFSLYPCMVAAEKLHAVELLVFCLLQELVFDRFYGKADCHAFCAGALLLCILGGDMKEFLLYMAMSYVLLFVIQAFKKNINSKGNLKIPVAFMPYITVSLWGILALKSMIV